MNALEHLIAAGQEHTGLVQAVRQVISVLNQEEHSNAREQLLQDSSELLQLLNQLAQVVTGALQQITAKPVQHISAERLEEIAYQMHRHLRSLKGLIQF